MANKAKHSARSQRSSHDRKIGMQYMDWNSNLKTQQKRRMKETIKNERLE